MSNGSMTASNRRRRARSATLVAALLAVVADRSVPARIAADDIPRDARPPLTAMIARLIVLDAPPRWDAWAAAARSTTAAPEADMGAATLSPSARAQAARAARRAGERIARAAVPVVDMIHAAGGTVAARYDTVVAGLLVHVPLAEAGDLDRRLRARAGVRRVVDPPLARVDAFRGRDVSTAVGLADPLPSLPGRGNRDCGVVAKGVTLGPGCLAPTPIRGVGARRAGNGHASLNELSIPAASPWRVAELRFRTGCDRCTPSQAPTLPGHGATIAVIDTGIDYTHAVFGGPGTVAAYEAAAAAADRIDDRWQGEVLFPAGRVSGGWDFAGPRYVPGCSPELQAAGACSVAPEPDPDPLDTHGHGTHVAGIAAGEAAGPLGAGMAPGARLVALKIFGRGDSTDLLIGALEWVVGANMGEGGRPRVDVVNLSLGIAYGARLLEDEGLIRRVTDSGAVVVAAAGNDDDLPFIVSVPAIAPEALAVASHRPPGQHVWKADVTAAGAPPAPFDETTLAHQAWSPEPRSSLSAPLVFVGRGCPGGAGQPPDAYLADPRGAVALFRMAWGGAGEACHEAAQVRRLQEAGAVAALMGTNLGVEVASDWNAAPEVDIPVWMVNGVLEQAVVDTARAPATPVPAIVLRPEPRPALDGVVSPFSSRGPARTGVLKPDLSAAGSRIYSAAAGQGERGVAASGTSMSAPQVAGAAARVRSAARAVGQERTARDVAAALINTADPAAVRQSAAVPGTPPLARTGCGGLDPAAAEASDGSLRSGALASLGFGVRAVSRPITLTAAVTLSHRAAGPRRYRLRAALRTDDDLGRGVRLTVAPAEMDLDPGAAGTAQVGVAVDPVRLPPWRLGGGSAVGDLEALADAEVDGWIEAEAIDPITGDPVDAGRGPLRVPFHVLARAASEVSVAAGLPGPRAPGAGLALANAGPVAGSVEAFTLIATDPIEADVPPKIDVDAVGIRARPNRDGLMVVDFLVHTRGVRMHPLETETLIEIDLDRDGRADFRAYTADEEILRTKSFRNGRVRAALESLDGDLVGIPTARYYAGVDLNSRFTIVPIVIDDTGLTQGTLAFDFRVQQRDLVERDLREPLVDHVPDRSPGAGGWLRYDHRRSPWRPERWSQAVAAGGRAVIAIEANPDAGPDGGIGLAALFPSNAPQADLALPAALPEPMAVYLPGLWRGDLMPIAPLRTMLRDRRGRHRGLPLPVELASAMGDTIGNE